MEWIQLRLQKVVKLSQGNQKSYFILGDDCKKMWQASLILPIQQKNLWNNYYFLGGGDH
jgi:hypothetical protein